MDKVEVYFLDTDICLSVIFGIGTMGYNNKLLIK